MALIVHLDSESAATVKFCKDKELQKLLCEVPILKTAVSVVQIALFSECSFKNNIQLNVESNLRLQWFYSTLLCYWSRKLMPLSQLIRCKTKRNHVLVFPCFQQIGCFYFEFKMPVVITLV